jgi:hypothetical protein
MCVCSFPCFFLRTRSHPRSQDKFEALEQIFGVENAAILRNYMTRVEVHRNQKIVEAGDRSYTLYLLQSGA